MSEIIENTLTAYKGPEFQQKLMWQLLVEPEFAEKTIPIIAVEYFDDPNIKRLFLIMLEYIKLYGKVPNLQNQSIRQAINEFKSPGNLIEEESLFAVLERVSLWNERILNQTLNNDGDAVQKATNEFIKQQEYRKFAEGVIVKVKNGEIRNKRTIADFEEKLQKIAIIGVDEDCGSDATEGLDKALMKEFRKTIPTGVAVIDSLTGGGLGKGEFGLILTPSGVGKTTLLTVIANTARDKNLNVLQIIFEDTKAQIQRKHTTIWTGIPLSQLDERNEEALRLAQEHINKMGPGRLTIKKFSQEDTTMKDIKDYILREQKKYGFKYDIVVLDYLDCLESHKKVSDRNEAELVIVKSFEALASDLDIPCWSAIQSNRSGFDAELVEAHQAGGNIKRIQKSHFFMSVAKTPDQKEASLANIRIIKARFAADGQTFKDCIFNNDTMEIKITDERYVGSTSKKMRYSQAVIDGNNAALESHSTGMIHVVASSAMGEQENPLLSDMRNKVLMFDHPKDDGVNDAVNDGLIPVMPLSNPTGLQTLIEINEVITDAVIIEDEILELDEASPITPTNEGAIEGAIEGAEPEIYETVVLREGVILPKLKKSYDTDNIGWTGESFTTAKNEIDVKFEDLPPTEQILEEKVVVEPIKIQPIVEKNDVLKEKFDIKTAENKLLIDPDDVSSTRKGVFDMLHKRRRDDVVMKKD